MSKEKQASESPSSSTLRPLTEFQKAILWAVEMSTNQMACTWTIAQKAFPEKWAKRSGRGALVGHIVTAAMKMPDLVGIIPAKDQFGTPVIFKRRNALMEKKTRKWLAAQAAKRWDRQYGPFIGQKGWKEEVWQKLKSLGENPEPDSVDEAIGNGSWTRLTCNECGKDVEEVIQIGETPDYESHTAWICRPCIKSAAELP